MNDFIDAVRRAEDSILIKTYEVAYAYLSEHPEYDGYPGEGVPRLLRCASRPGADEPYPGIRDVQSMTRSEWVLERLAAVERGDEEPGSCFASGGGNR